MLQKTYIKFTEHGMSRVSETESPIEMTDVILKQLINRDLSFIVRDVFEVAKHTVHMCVMRDVVSYALRLKTLPLLTYFKQSDSSDKHLIPVFRSMAGSKQMRLEWEPPAGMDLYFVLVEPTERSKSGSRDDDDESPEGMESYLVARVEKTLCKLPLPNIHSDAKICMNSGDDEEDTSTKQERIEQELEQFLSSAWNTDLAPSDMSMCHNLFRFIQPPKGIDGCEWKWVEISAAQAQVFCTNVSHTAFNWVAQL